MLSGDYKKSKEELKKICSDIHWWYKYQHQFLSLNELITTIKELRNELNNKLDNFLKVSIKRFSQVKNIYIKWRLNNEGEKFFSKYLIKNLGEYIKRQDKNKEKIDKTTGIITPISALACGSLLGPFVISENKNLIIPIATTGAVGAISLLINFLTTVPDFKHCNEFDSLICHLYDYKEANSTLDSIFEIKKEEYRKLSKKIKNGFTLEQAKKEYEEERIEIAKMHDKIFELGEQTEKLEGKINKSKYYIDLLSGFSGEKNFLKATANLGKIQKEFDRQEEEIRKESEFYAEKE